MQIDHSGQSLTLIIGRYPSFSGFYNVLMVFTISSETYCISVDHHLCSYMYKVIAVVTTTSVKRTTMLSRIGTILARHAKASYTITYIPLLILFRP